MTQTRPTSLVLLVLLGAAVGWFTQVALVAFGLPALIPPVTFALVLALVGIAVVLLALPIRRVVRGTAKARVDPFFATRVVILSKTASLAGSLFGGAAIAILSFLLSRSVVPGVGSLTVSTAAVFGAVIMLVGGLVAENMCTLPPDDGSENSPNQSGQP